MGKIKQKNYKYHSSAPVPMDADTEPRFDTGKQQSTLIDSSLHKLGPVQVQNNIFRNITIDPLVLHQKLPSTFSQSEKRRARLGLEINEPNPLCLELKKRLLAQKNLHRKERLTVKEVIAECKKKNEEDKVKLKKKKAAVLNDWGSLKDALCETKASASSSLSQVPPRKRKDIEKQMIQDMDVFYSALQSNSSIWKSQV